MGRHDDLTAMNEVEAAAGMAHTAARQVVQRTVVRLDFAGDRGHGIGL